MHALSTLQEIFYAAPIQVGLLIIVVSLHLKSLLTMSKQTTLKVIAAFSIGILIIEQYLACVEIMSLITCIYKIPSPQ